MSSIWQPPSSMSGTALMTDLTVKQLARQSYENSEAHGFWDSPETNETIPSKLMLIVSEVAEALESYRDPRADTSIKVPMDQFRQMTRYMRMASYANSDVATEVSLLVAHCEEMSETFDRKPKGFESELADVFIRLGDLAGQQGIDIEKAIQEKHQFNIGRSRMHGGRKV